MDKLIVIVLLVAAVIYFKYGDDDIVPVRPLYAESYVVVYGRQACGNTQYMEKTLNRSALQFYSGDFDDPVIREEIYGRMTMAGYDINKNFMLPIVDVNGGKSLLTTLLWHQLHWIDCYTNQLSSISKAKVIA